jgi:hypothetical protein
MAVEYDQFEDPLTIENFNDVAENGKLRAVTQ